MANELEAWIARSLRAVDRIPDMPTDLFNKSKADRELLKLLRGQDYDHSQLPMMRKRLCRYSVVMIKATQKKMATLEQIAALSIRLARESE